MTQQPTESAEDAQDVRYWLTEAGWEAATQAQQAIAEGRL